MKAQFFWPLFLVIVFFGTSNAVPLNSNEEEAKKFAQNASDQIFSFYNQLVSDVLDTNSEDAAASIQIIYKIINTSNDMAELVRKTQKFDHKKFKDQELRRVFEKLRIFADDAVVGGDQFVNILLARTTLETLGAEKDIHGYKNKSIMLAYYPDIQDIFATSNDLEELEYYWNAWREKNAEWATMNFMTLFTLLKEAAKLTEISAYEFLMKDYNITQMEEIMQDIQPFYRQLHAYLRNHLHKKYGDPIMLNDGLIPIHLFQQVLAQVWSKSSILEEQFPFGDLPEYDNILEANNYDANKMYEMADKFYESLGFEPIPTSYWSTRLKMKPSDDVGDCKAIILTKSTSVAMQYCRKMDFSEFLQAHGYMAKVKFALGKTDLPAYYFDSYDLENAVGEAVILSASSPKHLKAIGLVTDHKFTEEVHMNRLMRLSIHTMLNIPLFFVHTKVMAGLLAGMEVSELNKHYWELMDKYVGVGKPGDRVPSTYDLPFKFYVNLNENEEARKFYTKVIGYQFYERLCTISGQLPEGKLQNCDFYGSKDAGAVLKKMMKLGSSKPIQEVLDVMLPEDPKMKADSLLEYYFPVISWLSVENRLNNVTIGWTHST